MTATLVLQGGLVFDGRGRPPQRADIAIAAGRILNIGPELAVPAGAERVDARGLWVTPGFLDIHTHYDIEVEVTPGLPESVRHGVTTVIIGQCSLSLTVGDPETLGDIFQRVETLPRPLIDRWLSRAAERREPEAYFAALRERPLGPNLAAFVGHSALRAEVMGLGRSLYSHARPDEVEAMAALLRRCLDAGALGLSIDGVHWHKVAGRYRGRALPSHHASFAEVTALAEVCRERDAVLQVTPDPRRPSFLLRLLRLATGLGRAPLRLTLLAALDMTVHRQLWRVFPWLSGILNGPLGGNLRWQTLTEPFAVLSDGPITPLFEEFEAGVRLNSADAAGRRALWRDASFRAAFREEWERGFPRTFDRDLSRMRVVEAPDPALVGRSFTELAGDEAPTETFMALLERYDTALRWRSVGANDRAEVRRRLLGHPHILPGFSDAGAHVRNLAFQDSALSLLREAAQSGFMSPERAVQRVTSEPARWFNLDVGVLKPGARADILLLDPERLRDPIPAPTEVRDPLLEGAPRLVKRDPRPAVRRVYIAGVEVVEDGEPLPALGEARLGELLTHASPVSGGAAALRRQRMRINEVDDPHPFEGYWEVFVAKHQDPRNVAAHNLALVALYLIPLAALALGEPWLLALLPASQLMGIAAHRAFEPSPIDPQDGLFSWRALISLHRMFGLALRGRWGAEVARVRAELAAYEGGAGAPREEPACAAVEA